MLGRAKLLPGLTMSVSVFMLAAAGLHLVVAHHEIVTHENHEASISADHWVGNVCDMEYDGNAATAYFVLENGQTVSFIDPNGDGVEDPGHNGCWALTLESAAVFMGVSEETKDCIWERT
jgi:hypothetical protein